MVIYNLKINLNKIIKIVFILFSIIVLFIAGISVYKIFSSNYITVDDSIDSPDISSISANNYTNVLKCVHDDLDSYVGKKISFTGFVYRVSDFNDKEFVLARNMIISSDFQTVVVGFLCNCSNAKEFDDGTWVNITGKITKGSYHGEIPVLEITHIEPCEKPADEYVYPPDDFYVPTSALY